ncbi:MAG: ABC transporter permease [Salinisphaera sp.]|uniref:ABC transporter permease n=1 Tax=Salinisphaera sp. TaxID=1914330 RepID=UPI003C7C2FC5
MSVVAVRPGRRWRETRARELTLVLVTVALVIAVALIDPRFANPQNIRFMLLNSVVLSLVALGQTFVIAARGIDLSVAPLLGLSAMVCGLMAQTSGLPFAEALLISLSIGLVLGAVNGVLVSALKIPPIVVTLGTYSIYSGIIFVYSQGTQVNSVPPAYAYFGNGYLFDWLPLPIPVLVLLGVLGVCSYVLGHTSFGRAVLAIGNNDVAAYQAGVPVTIVRTCVYAVSGMLACFAGLMFLCYTGSATVTAGTGDHVELQSIAVALVGGTLISGGRGNLVGTVLGSLFLSVVLTSLVFLRVPPIWYSAGEGLMILATVQAGLRRRPAGER